MKSAVMVVGLVVMGCGDATDRPTADADLPDTADSALIRPNYVFITRATFDGALGGLVGADAKCNAAATAAGLRGDYVAWLSTSTVDAIDRLAGSRGWVRVDGEPVADRITSVFSDGVMFNSIDVDETGSRRASTLVWTGTDFDGRYYTDNNCNDWQTNAGAVNGGFGESHRAAVRFSYNAGLNCDAAVPLYCFEVGHDVAVAPTAAGADRVAFISTVRSTAGLAELDSLCQSNAVAAGIAGVFSAAVATPGQTAAARFTLDSRPVRRVDKTLVATSAAMLFGGSMSSFVNQQANGAYVFQYGMLFWTGALDAMTAGTDASTCANWSSTTSGTGAVGQFDTSDATALWQSSCCAPCDSMMAVMCLAK